MLNCNIGLFRELFEECNLTANNLDHVGILKFEFVGEPRIMEVHVFKTSSYEGSVQESEGIVRHFGYIYSLVFVFETLGFS
jgi:8-oxo-dGTP diphosphatase/2-hydroxy-dATP diphosphatase